MGGIGSGVPAGEWARDTTEAAKRIDAAYLNQNGLLRSGVDGTLSWTRGSQRTGWIRYRTHDKHLQLIYSADGEPLDYRVGLSRTPCHFGGARIWLHCPVVNCGRRVRVLYGHGLYFVCRHCSRLAYASTRENAIDLHARRGDRIRRRLGWPEGMFEEEGGRPKGMHWRTYWDLLDEYRRHRLEFLRGLDSSLGLGVFESGR
jgi:hypothetical protein